MYLIFDKLITIRLFILQYGLTMPVGLLRADNNLPPWRSGLKEVILLGEKSLCIMFHNFYSSNSKGIYLAVCLNTQVKNFSNICDFRFFLFFLLTFSN